jgi:hypothetical protein
MIHQEGKGSIAIVEGAQAVRDADHAIRGNAIRLEIDRVAYGQNRFGDHPRLTLQNIRRL